MQDSNKSIKAINFDIKQKLLDRYYEKSNTSAYYEIKQFMKTKGFEHRQGSGYISDMEITFEDVLNIINEMNTKMPWAKICIEKIDITEKYAEILSGSYMDERSNLRNIFDSIIDSGYRATNTLVQNMLDYTEFYDEVLNLDKVEMVLSNESNPILKEVLSNIQNECIVQDKEKEMIYQDRINTIVYEEELEEDRNIEL